MFSFLRYDYKKKILSLYRTRLITLYLGGIIVVSIFSVMMLVPSHMISTSRKTEVNAELDALKKSLDLKKNNDTELFIKTASQKIQVSLAGIPKGYISDVVINLVNNKRDDISLNDISLVKNQEGFNIDIAGVALTREGLLGFVKTLKSLDSFKDVNLPVSNLAKDKNISFTISLKSIL